MLLTVVITAVLSEVALCAGGLNDLADWPAQLREWFEACRAKALVACGGWGLEKIIATHPVSAPFCQWADASSLGL